MYTEFNQRTNSVSDTIKKAKQLGLFELADDMTNQRLVEFLFTEKQALTKGCFPVNLKEVHRGLQRKNITLELLHHEYSQRAGDGNKIPYAYRTFCRHYGKYANKYKLTMPIRRKPGKVMEDDWAGNTLSIKDRSTCDKPNVYVFVATLPYSQLFYAEGFFNMTSQSWLIAHIHAFEYFNGVAEVLVPDNLKTGLNKAVRGEQILNEAQVLVPSTEVFLNTPCLHWHL